MKKFRLFLVLFFSLSSIACKQKTLYFTPEATGYIYDSVTKRPLSNKIGYLGFNGSTPSSASIIKLEANGHFTIPAVTSSYYFIRPNVRQYMDAPAEIFISYDNYEKKILDYAPFIWKQVPERQSGFSYYKKINLGIIYLDPEKP
ncbi:MAG: hypothetical protein LKF90_11505 [Acinetobacter gerneri]|nr:hypothetical protein [Acinetobacter gerneri]MCH4244818.1 hypothetical protein [Acinetobacter gerneri]